ncbi:MAG: DUF819 family protein [FCB group bacterium]|nr:DUF819 family protein [FCB group bacterium]
MLSTIIWVIFFLACPALILFLCSKNKVLDSIGAIVICYAVGLLLGNIGIFPENVEVLQDALTTLVIPLALPLIFFSMDLHGWGKQAGLAVKSFTGALISVGIGAFIAFMVFSQYLGDEGWKMAGMLIGVYTGGTPNLAAIGTGLEISSSNYLAVHASDVLVCGVLFLLMLTVIPRILRRILPKYQLLSDAEHGENLKQMDNFEPYFKGFQKMDLLPLLGALGLSVVIFGIGGGLSLIVPEGISMVVAILVITTFGILASFVPKIRKIRMTFQLGHYFLLVFALVVSSMANISKLIDTAPIVMLYVATLLVLAFIIHTFISRLMKVDADTHLVSMTALVFSPPFVPVVAAVLKNKQVIMTGMLAGIAGWIIGNYAGIGFAYLMRAIFGG